MLEKDLLEFKFSKQDYINLVKNDPCGNLVYIPAIVDLFDHFMENPVSLVAYQENGSNIIEPICAKQITFSDISEISIDRETDVFYKLTQHDNGFVLRYHKGNKKLI